MPSSHDPLDPLLERWRKAAPPPPSALGAEVWRRIAVAAKPGWRTRVETAFARPSFALTFVAACIFLGLFMAEARIARLQAQRNVQLAQSYRHLIDPLLTQTPADSISPAPRQ